MRYIRAEKKFKTDVPVRWPRAFAKKIYLPRHFYKKHIFSFKTFYNTIWYSKLYLQTNRSIKMHSNKVELMQKVKLTQKMVFCWQVN